jgi:hypothetical protein
VEFFTRWRTATFVLSLSAIIGGCAQITVDIPRNPLPPEEINIRMVTRDYAGHFMQSVEESADRIILESGDLGIQTNALQWKINALAAIQNTVFQPAPKIALIDTWAFTAQAAQFFDGGQGREAFGSWQAHAVNTSKALSSRIEQISRSVLPRKEFDKAGEFVQLAVQEAPIQSLALYRESVLTRWTEFAGIDPSAVVSTVGTSPQVLEDFTSRLGFYEQTVPKRTRWMAESYMMETDLVTRLDNQFAELNETGAALASTASVVGSSFSRMEQQMIQFIADGPKRRAALADSLNENLGPMIGRLDRRLMDTTSAIKQFNTGWEASLVALTQERLALMDAYQTEREVVTRQMEDWAAAGWKSVRPAAIGFGAAFFAILLAMMIVPFVMGMMVGRAKERGGKV